MGKLANPARGRAMAKIATALRRLKNEPTVWITLGNERVELGTARDDSWWGEHLVSARHGYFIAWLGDLKAGHVDPINTLLVRGGPVDGALFRLTGFKIHAKVLQRHPRKNTGGD